MQKNPPDPAAGVDRDLDLQDGAQNYVSAIKLDISRFGSRHIIFRPLRSRIAGDDVPNPRPDAEPQAFRAGKDMTYLFY